MVKAASLRKKTQKELEGDLDGFRKNLSELRFSKVSASQQMKVSKIKTVRKDIARTLTVLNTMKKDEAREAHKKSKYQPLDLRKKLTRRLRRRLTRAQLTKTTLRTQKRNENFPKRKYAVLNN